MIAESNNLADDRLGKNNNKVSDDSQSRRRKKKKSKNNQLGYSQTREINKINNSKANNNRDFTHQTAVNDNLIHFNNRPKKKKESNNQLVGNDVQNIKYK